MLDPVTTRYAEALFNVARKKGVLEAVRSDVRRLADDLAPASVSGFFFDARVAAKTRRDKMQRLTKGLHPIVRDFVSLLFDKRREHVLRGLGEAFHRRALAERGAAEGIVESARRLGAGEVAQLGAAISARLGKQVTLENRIVPALVGGVRVVVESRMLDFSFAGRMEGLRKRLLDAPLPSARGA